MAEPISQSKEHMAGSQEVEGTPFVLGGNQAPLTIEPGSPISSSDRSPGSTNVESNEKLHAGIAVRKLGHPVSLSSEEECTTSRRPTRPWRTALLRFGPLSGIFAMLIAIASIIASLGILAGSNGKAVIDWSVEPSILLAIFTAIANLAMRYACIQGVLIAWWVRALRGSTLGKLHWDWRSGTTLRGALTAGRNTGLLAIATIFSTLVVIDGPLLQRASSVVPAPIVNQPVSLDITMAPEVPTDYTGAWATMQDLGRDQWWGLPFNSTQPSPNGTVPNNIYAAVVATIEADYSRLYFSDTLPQGLVRGCHGTCKASITAPAFATTSCRSTQVPLNWSAAYPLKQYKYGIVAFPLDHDSFFVTSELVLDEYETVNLVTGYGVTSGPDCVGSLNYTACTLQSAIGIYNVTVTNNATTLDAPASPDIVSLANNTRVNHEIDPELGAHPSTLGGPIGAFNSNWESLMSVQNEDGHFAGSGYNEATYSQYQTGPSSHCSSYSDPFEDSIAQLNRAMVFAGALAAYKDTEYLERNMDPGLANVINTTTTGYYVGDHNVFRTDYWFFFAAALVEVVCIAFIAPTYWGWWHIGRPVSFSPLEMAKAFDSPTFAKCNSNSSGRDIARVMSDVEVQYGVTRLEMSGDVPASTKLEFSDPQTVDQPTRGARFGV